MTVLGVRGLDVTAGDRVLARTVDFTVDLGECIGLVGQNGVGKSTLLDMLAGRTAVRTGVIEYGNSILSTAGGWQNGIGFATADLVAPELLTIREYVHILHVARQRSDDDGTLLDRLDLTTHLDSRIATLSTGQRKKVGFAAALLHRPALFMCDEPFEGLDDVSARTVAKLIEEQVRRGGAAIVCTHRLHYLGPIANRVFTIHDERMTVEQPGDARENAWPRS